LLMRLRQICSCISTIMIILYIKAVVSWIILIADISHVSSFVTIHYFIYFNSFSGLRLDCIVLTFWNIGWDTFPAEAWSDRHRLIIRHWCLSSAFNGRLFNIFLFFSRSYHRLMRIMIPLHWAFCSGLIIGLVILF
jgi:hypothetical protein